MSTFFEPPTQGARDLRNKERKRYKDSAMKWSFGSRPLTGCRLDWATGEVYGGNDDIHRSKARPRGKASNQYGSSPKKVPNITKLTGGHCVPSGRVRTIHALEEIQETSRSVAELLLPPTQARQIHSESDVLYSYDRDDTPSDLRTLGGFVMAPTDRAMERLVEREYEILDVHGNALKGRKARRTLRNAKSADLTIAEDDDFEVVSRTDLN